MGVISSYQVLFYHICARLEGVTTIKYTFTPHQWLKLGVLVALWLTVMSLRIFGTQNAGPMWWFGIILTGSLTIFIGWKARSYAERSPHYSSRPRHHRHFVGTD